MKKIFISIFILVSFSSFSQDIPLHSQAGILVDVSTEQILFQKNIDMQLAPASLTKLLTFHTAQLIMKEKGIDVNDTVEIPVKAYWYNLPDRAVALGLLPGTKISYDQLFSAMMIPSANDAALAVAISLGGTEVDFVTRMNQEAQNLGMTDSYFADTTGLSSDSYITAADFMSFILQYLRLYPDALEKYHSRETYSHPDVAFGPHYNTNPILTEYAGVDGLKTGFIEAVGYNLSFTASKKNTRLAGVLIGAKADSLHRGNEYRKNDSINLLEYGFNAFQRVLVDLKTQPGPQYTYFSGFMQVYCDEPIEVYAHNKDINKYDIQMYLRKPLVAPLERGTEVGSALITLDGKVYKEFNLYADEALLSTSLEKLFEDSLLIAKTHGF